LIELNENYDFRNLVVGDLGFLELSLMRLSPHNRIYLIWINKIGLFISNYHNYIIINAFFIEIRHEAQAYLINNLISVIHLALIRSLC